MPQSATETLSQPVLLGFDPGRAKCGLAVVGLDRALHHHQVVPAADVLSQIEALRQTYAISAIVMGDQTGAKDWQAKLKALADAPRISLIDERHSSLEARDRYWQMYPPRGLTRLVPQGVRNIPRQIDDIVAILLVERYLDRLTGNR